MQRSFWRRKDCRGRNRRVVPTLFAVEILYAGPDESLASERIPMPSRHSRLPPSQRLLYLKRRQLGLPPEPHTSVLACARHQSEP
jgi:hypothetical protein